MSEELAVVGELPVEAEFTLVSILTLLRVFGFCEAVKLASQQWTERFGPRNSVMVLANGNLDVPAEVEWLFSITKDG